MIRYMTYRIKYSYYIFIYIICIFVIDQTVRLYNAFSIDTCTFIVKTYKYEQCHCIYKENKMEESLS